MRESPRVLPWRAIKTELVRIIRRNAITTTALSLPAVPARFTVMGNILGNAGRFISRKTRRFNVESRTHRFLEKGKVQFAAPKYESTAKEVEELHRAQPQLMEDIHKRDTNLIGRLQKVYVSSHGPAPASPKALRPLPVDRKAQSEPNYGYVEPESNTPGRLSLKRVLELLSQYHQSKGNLSSKQIASEYNLQVKDVENLVSYYRVFKFQIIDKDKRLMQSGTEEPKKAESVSVLLGGLKKISKKGSYSHLSREVIKEEPVKEVSIEPMKDKGPHS